MAKTLVQLKMLTLRKCHMVKEIVGSEGDDHQPTDIDDDDIEFTRLESLILDDLSSFKSFCSAKYTFRFPSLKSISLGQCPKMEFFCKGVLDAPRLGTDHYPFTKYWEGDLNTTIHKMFMKQV